jgi:hypothetical protein
MATRSGLEAAYSAASLWPQLHWFHCRLAAMDEAMERPHLAQADRHIDEGEERIAYFAECIAEWVGAWMLAAPARRWN